MHHLLLPHKVSAGADHVTSVTKHEGMVAAALSPWQPPADEAELGKCRIMGRLFRVSGVAWPGIDMQ